MNGSLGVSDLGSGKGDLDSNSVDVSGALSNPEFLDFGIDDSDEVTSSISSAKSGLNGSLGTLGMIGFFEVESNSGLRGKFEFSLLPTGGSLDLDVESEGGAESVDIWESEVVFKTELESFEIFGGIISGLGI